MNDSESEVTWACGPKRASNSEEGETQRPRLNWRHQGSLTRELKNSDEHSLHSMQLRVSANEDLTQRHSYFSMQERERNTNVVVARELNSR